MTLAEVAARSGDLAHPRPARRGPGRGAPRGGGRARRRRARPGATLAGQRRRRRARRADTAAGRAGSTPWPAMPYRSRRLGSGGSVDGSGAGVVSVRLGLLTIAAVAIVDARDRRARATARRVDDVGAPALVAGALIAVPYAVVIGGVNAGVGLRLRHRRRVPAGRTTFAAPIWEGFVLPGAPRSGRRGPRRVVGLGVRGSARAAGSCAQGCGRSAGRSRSASWACWSSRRCGPRASSATPSRCGRRGRSARRSTSDIRRCCCPTRRCGCSRRRWEHASRCASMRAAHDLALSRPHPARPGPGDLAALRARTG